MYFLSMSVSSFCVYLTRTRETLVVVDALHFSDFTFTFMNHDAQATKNQDLSSETTIVQTFQKTHRFCLRLSKCFLRVVTVTM